MSTVRYERSNSNEQMQFNILSDSGGANSIAMSESPQCSSHASTSPINSTTEETMVNGNVLCTHEGVLLKKASAENIADLNTSGSLSLVEYGSSKRKYIEWKPSENILIADDSQDQEDWALVDTILRRSRTVSECKVFNTKPMESSTGSLKSRVIRSLLDDFSSIEVKQRRQTIKFIRKADDTHHTEFFFQNGNAELFLNSLKKLHVIDLSPTLRSGEEYEIFPTETQKLKKTFAELDISEIKASSLGNEGWLPQRVMGLLASIPDYMANKAPPKNRPSASVDAKERQNSSPLSDNYLIVGINGSINTSDFRSTASNLEKSPGTDSSDVENVKEVVDKIIPLLPYRRVIIRGLPFCSSQWCEFQIPDGRISDPDRVLEFVYRGSIDPNLRPKVWKYLLNYDQWNDTEEERLARRKQKYMEYYSMKAQWLSMTTVQEANFSGYRDRKCQIEKDVKRTDRTLDYFAGDDNPNLLTLQGILMTYVMYNFDLGYVQGMSDLLAPILETMKNEVDAFWCFVGFMDMVFANFDMDQAGMKTQFNQLRDLLEIANPRLFKYLREHDSDNMYFCFRWLLVWFKREFSNEDILQLWECLWTKYPCSNYHLIVSLAILEQQTDIIIENQYEFNEILKHVNELSGNINIRTTLEIAEGIYHQLKEVKNLPNHIKAIIGDFLFEYEGNGNVNNESSEGIGDIDDYIRELSPEEKRRNQELLEEAYERSMFLQYM